MADRNVITYWIWTNRLILFLTVLDIFDDKSVNSTFRNKKCQDRNDRPKIKFKYKLRWILVVGNFWHYWLYKLVHDSKIQNNRSNRLDEIYRKLVATDREL